MNRYIITIQKVIEIENKLRNLCAEREAAMFKLKIAT